MPLALTRKPHQTLTITPKDNPEVEIKIYVASIANGQVRLSIDAPDEYLIYREEIMPITGVDS